MKIVEKYYCSVNISDYKVVLANKAPQNYSLIHVYNGDKLIARIDEEHGQIYISGQSIQFEHCGHIVPIDLLKIANDSILVYCETFDLEYIYYFEE